MYYIVTFILNIAMIFCTSLFYFVVKYIYIVMRRNLWSNDWCVRSSIRSGVSVVASFSRKHQLAMLELLKNIYY